MPNAKRCFVGILFFCSITFLVGTVWPAFGQEPLYGFNPGQIDNAGGGNHGVFGETRGDWGWASGVYGRAYRDHAIGVTGWNTRSGVGLYGYSESGPAVVAKGGSGNLIEGWDARPNELRFRVTNNGDVYADRTYHSGGVDFAEFLPALDGLQPGEVLVIGPDGKLTHSTEARSTNVVGVYSTAPGFVGGDVDSNPAGKVPLAIMNIVPVKVNAENGLIRPGNMLVASSTPGYAMNAGSNPAVGTVIGKAMERLHDGSGVVRVLLMLR